MNRDQFCDALLSVMERKDHWAWPAFTAGRVPKDRLQRHFEQEYATYVRDFPVMVGWAYVQCPIPEVRRGLAENLYEEETGGLVAGKPHPELFLEYPRGLNMDVSCFANVQLIPAARRYRAFLDDATQRRGWEVAAAVVTIFIEGTKDDRAVVEPSAKRPVLCKLEEHPLVKHYGLPVEFLALTKAHRAVEHHHRAAAWDAILNHVPETRRLAVVSAMNDALHLWLAYRDAVAVLCGVRRNGKGSVQCRSASLVSDDPG